LVVLRSEIIYGGSLRPEDSRKGRERSCRREVYDVAGRSDIRLAETDRIRRKGKCTTIHTEFKPSQLLKQDIERMHETVSY
jgi:hypothetical protein